MEKVIKETLKNELESMVIDYFANSTSTSDICDEIRKHISVSDEQENSIGLILFDYNLEWIAAPCNPEGANKKQNKVLDKIINDCVKKIINILN